MATSTIIGRDNLILIATGGVFNLPANSFTTIPLTATKDVFNKLSSNIYSVNNTSNLLIVSKIRVRDNQPLTNYGQGVHTSNIDGTWMAWANTNSGVSFNRNTLINIRMGTFNINDSLRLYAISDVALIIDSAELNISII